MPSRGHKPVRTCVACRQEALKSELLRMVRSQDGQMVVDPTGRAPGRGAYVHHQDACLQKARKRGANIPSV